MPPVTRITGRDARILINGVVFQHFKRCDLVPRAEVLKARPAGGYMQLNVPFFLDYELRVTVLMNGAEPYVSLFGFLSWPVAFALKVKSTDAGGFLLGTGVLVETPFSMTDDTVAEHSFTILPDGTNLFYNPTPSGGVPTPIRGDTPPTEIILPS